MLEQWLSQYLFVVSLIAAYFGEKYISIAIICDQVTFLYLATAEIVVAIKVQNKLCQLSYL